MDRKTRLGYQIGLIGFASLSLLVRLMPRLNSVASRCAPRLLVLLLGALLPAPLACR